MAFVNELVPEEQKSKFDPKVFFNPTQFNGPIEMFRWTIDRERDVFLIRLGGGGREPEIPKLFALSWKGNVVKFDALIHSKGTKEVGLTVDWNVSNVHIPPQLEMEREEVLKLLKEGLDAMGSSICDRNGVVAVNVHFQ
jgi:hypothetical protein